MKILKLPVAVYLVLVFGSGVLVGVLGDGVYRARVAQQADRRPRTPEDFRKRYVSEMEARLKLNGAQVRQLEAILDQTRSRYREVRERLRPEMRAIQDEQVGKIQSILDPSQQAEYRKIREERESQRRQKSR